jgi:flavodoxin/ferredoxin
MAKALIVYFSQGGTTTQVADRIAGGLRTNGHHVDLFNMKDDRPPDVGSYELLGIGFPVYYYRPPFNVMEYLHALPDLNGLPSFVFVLHGTYRFDAGTVARRALARKRAREVGYYHCRGAEFWVGYLHEGYVFSPGHPTDGELARAEAFGFEIAARVAGRQYAKRRDDEAPSPVYRLERFLTNRWLARNVYSRLFRVDRKKCDSCGLCLEVCPMGNITEVPGKRLRWGRDCLLCLYCELKCPVEAITSPASWPLFRPFAMYNVWRAAADRLLDHERVDPRTPLHLRGEHLRVVELAGRSAKGGAAQEQAELARR